MDRIYIGRIPGAGTMALTGVGICFPIITLMSAFDHDSLKLYFFGFVMMAFQFAGQSVFVALGRAKQAVFFSLFRKIVIVVPLTILLPYVGGLGVNGVFLAEPISNFVGGLACYMTMYFTVYRKLEGPGNGQSANSG